MEAIYAMDVRNYTSATVLFYRENTIFNYLVIALWMSSRLPAETTRQLYAKHIDCETLYLDATIVRKIQEILDA